MRFSLFLCLAFFGMAGQAWAWADHHLITRAALQGADMDPALQATVRYSDFTEMVKSLGYADAADFKRKIQINTGYSFEAAETSQPPLLGEHEGVGIAVLDILSKYSDEPDWGMDQGLFAEGQYPELWRPQYAFMGGNVPGTPSQAFRHMYWQPLDPLHPIRTFRLPLSNLLEPMGEAPERAALFVALARVARQRGHEYWAVRFLADAIHYLEDCAQPFHTVQVPSKRFLWMPFFGTGRGALGLYVREMTNIVSYYHFAFEDYASRGMSEFFARDLAPAASSGQVSPSLSYADRDPAALVRAMARIGMLHSTEAGSASLEFFPPIQGSYASFDPGAFERNAAWWDEMRSRAQGSTRARDDYFRVVGQMFAPLGQAVRGFVESELGASSGVGRLGETR